MPSLFDVATHFDDIDILNAYVGSFAFKGQFSTFDESAPDGSVVKRRTLSVKPGTLIPTRRVITFLSEVWIVGDGNNDGIFNAPIRTAYWLKKSVGLFNALTPLQICTGLPGTPVYANLTHARNDAVSSSSDVDAQFYINLSKTEAVPRGTFLSLGADLYHVRASYVDEAGFRVCLSDKLESVVVSVQLNSAGVFDPITDEWTGATTAHVGVLLEYNNAMQISAQDDANAKAGDKGLVTAVAPTTGVNVVISGRPWQVLNVQPRLDGFLSHIRQV